MIAFDTNVLIHACDRSNPARQQLALDLIHGTNDGVLLWQVACEFIAASRKLAGQGFTSDQAWDRLNELACLLPLVLPAIGVFEHARVLHCNEGFAFWDALIISACIECGANRLYTEDVPAGRIPTALKIVNPFASLTS